MPQSKQVREPDALFKFGRSRLPITFDAHLATRQLDDWVKYKGEALLNISEPGRYVFSATIQASKSDIHCGGYFKVGSNVVIELGDEVGDKPSTELAGGQNKSLSNGMTLSSGNYDASFLIACWVSWGFSASRMDESTRPSWQATSFDLQVRGPSDDVLRPFGAKELFYLVREKKASSATVEPNSAPDAVPVEPPGKGSKRLVNVPVNVRSKPDVTGAAVRKLVPGDQVVVLDAVAGGQWVSIEVGGQFIGFVKTTALLANSQEL